MHSTMGNSEEAIKNYLIALENKELEHKDRLAAITFNSRILHN